MPKRYHPGAGRAPSRHAQRRAMQIVASGYGYGEAGASSEKRALKGFDAVSGSAPRDIDDHSATLRQRSRILFMSAPLARSGILTMRTNVVGSGLAPKPLVDASALGLSKDEADEWNAAAEREFALWADDKRNCDATGVNNFYGMQQLALASALLSGDVFALRTAADATPLAPYSLRLRLVEADRVATPRAAGSVPALGGLSQAAAENGNVIHDGVEIDKGGAIAAYWFRQSHPQDGLFALAADYRRVEAFGARTGLPNVLHVMDAERPEQYRGVPLLAPVIEPLLQLRRYTESELVAAVIESFFTAFVKTSADPTENPFPEVAAGGPPDEEEDDEPRAEYEMGPGQVNVMEPGEDVVFADPKRPSSGFDSFVQSVCKQIGAALEIPADLLTKDFDKSYSASRAALMEAWKSFRMRRTWLVDDFCAPVWEMWMSEAVALGRLRAPGFFTDPIARRAWLSCRWVGPAPGQLDPTKEVSAEILSIENGLTTRTDAAIRLNGSDFRLNAERLAAENEALAAAGAAGPTALSYTALGAPARAAEDEVKGRKEEDD